MCKNRHIQSLVITVIASIVLVILMNNRAISENSKSRIPAILKNDQKFLVLEGTPYNRGLIHGKTLRNEIHEIINLWKADLKKTYKIDPDVFITKFLNETNFISAIKNYTPDLLE